MTSEQYRLRARACTHAAYGTNDPDGREALLELADQWMRAADALERAEPAAAGADLRESGPEDIRRR